MGVVGRGEGDCDPLWCLLLFSFKWCVVCFVARLLVVVRVLF